jgi:hypothetical protein
LRRVPRIPPSPHPFPDTITDHWLAFGEGPEVDDNMS